MFGLAQDALEILRLLIEEAVDVPEHRAELFHDRDAVAHHAEPHAGLQQHEAGADAS